MSSQVNPAKINENYPVAGQNNSTSGFRNNFLAIKNAFSEYVLEMNDVINKSIVSAPLTYGTQITFNNFAGMVNGNLALMDIGLVTSDITAASANTVPTLNFSNTAVANIYITASSPEIQTINLTNFPNLGYSEIVLQLTATNPPQYINFSSLVPNGTINTNGNLNIPGYNKNAESYIITSDTTIYLKLVSSDGVNFILLCDLASSSKLYTPLSAIGSPGDTDGTISHDSNYFYVCVGNYDGITNIWKKISLTSV